MIENEEKKKKKIIPNSISIQMVGDLLLAKPTEREQASIFRRYEALLEGLANMDREERLINYKFLTALILTSHAKKSADKSLKKHLFDLKNDLFLNLANDKTIRKKIAFRYLVSKNFRVIEFCDTCKQNNEAMEDPKHKKKFCSNCNVDNKFYNVLSMHHKFDQGSMTLYLSNDMLHRVEDLRNPKKGKLSDAVEEGQYQKYHYNVRNLDIFDLDVIKKIHAKLLK